MVRLFSKPVAGGLVALCLVAGAAVPLAHAMPAHPVVVTAPSAPAIETVGWRCHYRWHSACYAHRYWRRHRWYYR